MKLLLHACCGPCSLEPVRLLLTEGHDIHIAYMNSNIHPIKEYMHRKDTLLTWAESMSLPVIEGVYDRNLWERDARHSTAKPDYTREDRCRTCYRLRFKETALYALAYGFDGISTTLSVSPYQFTNIIAEELQAAANSHGLSCVFRDFRPYYPEATRQSKNLGMYRQKYCGCHFSLAETQEERAAQSQAAQKAQVNRKLVCDQVPPTNHAAKNNPRHNS